MPAQYLSCQWTHNGMDAPELNCWGLVRLARHELYGLSLLPAHGDIHASDKRALTQAARAVVAVALAPTYSPRPGDIASVWRGALCLHVALVVKSDGRLSVLEIGDKIGARIVPLTRWEREQTRVIYYRDKP